ncbi:single-stranded DNA-binding protein 3 isoform X1 [Exaiptasia diaphana]|uniref:LisH domain-containing protein n=1 Tax=Exaiptasia diaphana TaxID=2652724 RepID=A0A913XE16_EXADI|nr:single-stranded DNA-binding protein 3 isoform X1 [Exaiptasia diaphana]KXJ12809.1 Single-stranded DNA-binding protein 3 [Exaiptasia diaphana]
MYSKGKANTVPSDAQATEKLALYVYEYLLHVGAQKSAQTFLNEIRWEKNITLGEPPGFLHSWWCVFWDLYCAAPERRDSCDHSSEAKAFHDYVIPNIQQGAVPSPGFAQMSNEAGAGGPGMQGGMPGYFTSSQASPHQQPPPPHQAPGGYMPNQVQNMTPQGYMPNQPPYMSRYTGGRAPNVRMPGQGLQLVWSNEKGFAINGDSLQPPGGVSGVPGAQPLLPNTMDPTRQQSPYQGNPMQGPMSRMNHPRVPVQPNYGGMRPPPNTGVAPGVNMPMGSRPWNPTTSVSGPPGTPIMPSPQDTANSGNESMYAMMKSVPGGNMPGYGMGGGPEPPMSIGGQEPSLVMNDSNPGDMDGLSKDTPNDHQPGTPREDGSEFSSLLPFSQDNNHCDSAAILKIKESMQEEAKRFEHNETRAHDEPNDYY